ncbi:DnaB-like helicase C-terminal domain-containing protein [Clostridium sardiniense]|uniref:DnaB-like helicase C-terminal domain-containing protein n=1 Tax=Clostridium sardiniense TaxID=29369 RepID=UPI00195CB953|nr:DnaB-like helicase C-terminal domain-containing protein [Clostridium sardiniense]MBM7836479.1 replicative DNA helicase [Clostridium sardiniense]
MTDYIIDKYKNIDGRLLESRLTLEGKIIGCLWSNPDSFDDYRDLNLESFITEDGRFYYKLGKDMAEKGYEYFDEVTVSTYLDEKPTVKEGFALRGGYISIKQAMESVNIKNISIYIDDLFKKNMIIEFKNEGFNIFEPIIITENNQEKELVPFELFKNMNSQQVAEWYDWRLQSITMSKAMGNVKIVDLDLDDKFINACDSGEETGLPYNILGKDMNDKIIWGSPIMSNATLGIHRGDAELIGAYSGKGKSSYIVENRVLPIVYNKEKVCIMANEMNIDKYKGMILPMILSHFFGYYGITRRNLKKGGFMKDPEKAAMVKKAQEYYREHFLGKIKFVELEDYSMNSVQRVVKRLARQGVAYFVYDTFKSENMANENTRGKLIENSKTLFQLAKKYNIGMTIVMQLAIHTEGMRFLTSSCLSEAKGVKEVLSEIIIFRELWNDEYPGEKYDVKPYVFIKDKESGKYTNIKKEVTLDPDKKYRIFFLDKTRNGDDGQAIIYQFDGKYNRWYEMGFCMPSHIDKRGK